MVAAKVEQLNLNPNLPMCVHFCYNRVIHKGYSKFSQITIQGKYKDFEIYISKLPVIEVAIDDNKPHLQLYIESTMDEAINMISKIKN